jgi:serine/threonine-protein phosphatase 6 regulatory ankyrin repeat subunit B
VGKVQEAKLAKCSHCGAKLWNILGDADTGYVLTQGGSSSSSSDSKDASSHKPDVSSSVCLVRQGSHAMTAPCDSTDVPYTPLNLQFASAADIRAMSAPGARLVGAASDGDKKLLQSLLKQENITIHMRDWDDLTALIPAASKGDLDMVKFLVKEGIDVNAKDKDGITALMEASIMGHAKVVEYLVEQGNAEVDAPANSGVTALWLAAGEGQAECMKVLLNKQADATNTRIDGISALMTASVGGHAGAVKLLLEHGADPKVTDGDGLTPLMNAAENGTVPVLKLLADHVKKDPTYLDAFSNTGFNAMMIAAAHGHADAIKFLIDAGASVSAVHDNGVTPLMYAAAANHVSAMQVLLEHGKVDINAMHSNKGTALLEAATGGAVDAMKLLLEHGAKVDFVDEDGVTPLMAVASQGNATGQAIVLEYLQKSFEPEQLKEHINMLAHSGGSAVMFAAAGGHYNCTKQLIELGANVKAIAKSREGYMEKLQKMIADGTVPADEDPHVDGVTALHVAAQRGYLTTVELLLEHGADVTVLDDEQRSALLLAVKGNHAKVAAALVKAGADPNTPFTDAEGETHNLLMDAIMLENEDFSTLLIDSGANLYYQDAKKVSTLLQASHRGLTEICRKLIDKNAASTDPAAATYLDEANEEGITPLIAAASEGHSEIAKLLIAAKANVNAKDKDGTSALMAAAARGHIDVVKLMVEAGASVNEQNVDGHTALMFAYNGKNQVETLWERYNQFVAEQQIESGKTIASGDSSKKAGDTAVDDGGTGPIIRQALDNHTALVDLLLKNGADESIRDKEGHTAKDFDFNRDADANILSKEAKAEKLRDESKKEL